MAGAGARPAPGSKLQSRKGDSDYRDTLADSLMVVGAGKGEDRHSF